MLKVSFQLPTSVESFDKKSMTRLISSAVYAILDDSKHIGFKLKSGKIFKDSVFDVIYSNNEIILKFNSLDDFSIENVAKSALSKEFKIGDIKYSDVNVEILKNNIDYLNSVIVTESNVLVYRTVGGKREFIFPENKEFVIQIKRNLLQKFELFYGKKFEDNLSIKILKQNTESRCSYYNKFPYFTKRATYMIHSSNDMLDLIAKTGIGSGNMKGFGLVEPMDLG